VKDVVTAFVHSRIGPHFLALNAVGYAAIAGYLAASQAWTAFLLLGVCVAAGVVAINTAYQNGRYDEFDEKFGQWMRGDFREVAGE
jgi:hypothetical protein